MTFKEGLVFCSTKLYKVSLVLSVNGAIQIYIDLGSITLLNLKYYSKLNQGQNIDCKFGPGFFFIKQKKSNTDIYIGQSTLLHSFDQLVHFLD